MASLAAIGAIATPVVSASTEFGAASLAAGTVSGVGSVMQGQASKAAAGYAAAVQRQNAQIATQNAVQAGEVGNENAGIQGLKNRAAVGGMLAAQGANNVDVNSGSAVSVREGQQEAGMLSAQTIRANAARQAYGFQTQAANATGQAAEDIYSGQVANTAGLIGAGADILGGTGKAGQLLGGTSPTGGAAYQVSQNSNYLWTES